MSLIAWYPLNGDLRDYSGHNRHLSINNGVGLHTSGKIGKCYHFDGTGDYMGLPASENTFLPSGNAPFSVAVWFTLATIPTMRYDLWTWGNSAPCQLNGCDIYADKMNFYNYSNDPSFIYEPFVVNKWYHFVVTYDGTTLKQYLNGVLKTTNTFGNFQVTKGTQLSIGRDWGRDISYHNGRMNDFRIYDHALSEKEISEIKKAKVLHYSFDDFQEPTENIIMHTNLDTGWQKEYCTGIQWNDSPPPEGINSPVVSFYCYDTNQDGYWYCYEDLMPQKPNTVYTVSLYVKTRDSNFRINMYTADNYEVGRYSSEVITVPNDGQWHRCVWNSFTNPANSQSNSLSFHFNYGSPQGENQRTWFCAPQMEAKDHATPFVAGRRDAIIKDRSGLMNDAILSGNEGVIIQSSYGVTVSGDTVQKTSGTSEWNAGAYSKNCFYDDCFLEWKVDYEGRTGVQVGAEMVGFFNLNTTWSFTDINFALYTNSNGDVKIYESGTDKGTKATWNLSSSNVFRIEVRNKIVYYYMNGTLLYTSTVEAVYPLYVDMALHTYGYPNKITNLKAGYLPTAKINPQWTEDSKTGKGAYKFNGSNYFKTKQLFFDNINQCHTVNAWIYPENTVDGTTVIDSKLINFNLGYYIEFYQDGKTLLYLNSAADNSYVYGPVLPRNTWSMVTYVFETATLTCKIYINGVLYASAHNYEATDTQIGFSSETIFGQKFKGKIDDIQIYATALSAADIKSLYETKGSIDNIGNFYVSSIVENTNWDDSINAPNLVMNGDCKLRSNKNFSSFVYDASNHCFSSNIQEQGILSEEFIPVNKDDVYKLSGEFKDLTENMPSGYYFGIVCFDSKKRFILPWNVFHYDGTETTLAVALKPGATTMTLTSSANWFTNLEANYYFRTIGFWGPDSDYPAYTNTSTLSWYSSISGNVLTLTEPWTGPEMPAGTPVANMYSGNTYNYLVLNEPSPPNWVKQEFAITGWSNNDPAETSKFRYGTEYILICVLSNYTGPSTLGVRNIKFWNTTSRQELKTIWGARSVNEKAQLLSNSFSEVGITDRLRAWWKLEGNTLDYSGNNYDGTIIGNVTLDTGMKGLAYKFPTDASSHIKLPVQAMQNLNDFAVSCWVNLYDITMGSAIMHGTINGNNAFLLFLRNDNNVEVWINDNSYVFPVAAIEANKWHHVALVREGTTLSVFVNGVVSTTVCTESIINITGYLLLGQEHDGVGTVFDINQCLRGKLTDLRIYDKALTDEEVGILYEITSGSKAVKLTDKCTYISGQFKEV